MGTFDARHWRHEQYRSASGLARRANLHLKYGTAPEPLFDWALRLVDWADARSIVDIGCGAGAFWTKSALGCLGAEASLVLADLSVSMLEEVALPGDRALHCRVAGDAERLPWCRASVDIAVCVNVLYHCAHPERAVEEIARVVRPGGTALIITNGTGHMRELHDALVEVWGKAGAYPGNPDASPDSLAATAADAFDSVVVHRYNHALEVTDRGDVIAFATSIPPANRGTPTELAHLESVVSERFKEGRGVVRIRRDTAALLCKHHPRA